MFHRRFRSRRSENQVTGNREDLATLYITNAGQEAALVDAASNRGRLAIIAGETDIFSIVGGMYRSGTFSGSHFCEGFDGRTSNGLGLDPLKPRDPIRLVL